MTAFVLPNLDQSTIDELRKRMPDMSSIEIPNLEKAGKDLGKTADQALDKLLGRDKMPVWPWVAGSIALAAILGAVAAWFTWYRRPSSVDTLADDGAGSWQAPSAGAGSTSPFGDDLGDNLTATDQAVDRATTDAIGTFGDRTAEEYPAAER